MQKPLISLLLVSFLTVYLCATSSATTNVTTAPAPTPSYTSDHHSTPATSPPAQPPTSSSDPAPATAVAAQPTGSTPTQEPATAVAPQPQAPEKEALLAPWADEEGWPMVAANPARTSWITDSVAGPFNPEWYVRLEPYISQKVQIIAAYDTLYVSTARGLYALDADTGTEKWVYQTELPLGNSPTIFNGVAYVGGFDRNLHAIDALTGDPIWTFPADAGFHTNPLVLDRGGQTVVYAGNRDGTFYAIADQGTNPQLLWEYETDGPILYSAAYQDDTVYFASNDMHAYALHADSGNLVWQSAKLPGHGFHSFWPVVYQNFVVFSGGWNYRTVSPFPTEGPNELERNDVYPPGMSPGDPIGPWGTEPGNWAAGTATINASAITDYYETYPWRRTYFVLNRANGTEYTFDSDGDGNTEYAPILYFGAKGGYRFPPAVGPDNVLYQANNYIYSDHIARGHVSGWKVGTPFISIPNGITGAVDEPLAYAIAGNLIYWKLCCDRAAGVYSIEQPSFGWGFYDQGGDKLRQTLPDLFDVDGWPYSYWKHGDQSPPLPYKDRVYTISNNAIVAFSANGMDPVLPPDEDPGSYTGEKAADVERGTTLQGLNTKVTLNQNTWPLLIQQETYFIGSHNSGARARYFRLFEVAGSASAPSSFAVTDNGPTTVLTSTFGSDELIARISQRTPTILFHNSNNYYALDGALAGIAYTTSAGVVIEENPTTINGADLTKGSLLIWDKTDTHRWSPIVISLQNRPNQITFDANGLTISFSGAAGHLAVTPLYGMSDPQPGELAAWQNSGIPGATLARIDLLDRVARSFPISVVENLTVDAITDDATLSYQYNYLEFSDDWNTSPLRLAYVPTHLALAAWNGSPIQVNGQPLDQHTDLEYLTPLGRVAGVANTNQVTVRLPQIAKYWRNPPRTSPAPPPGDPLLLILIDELDKMIQAGHLRPGYAKTGSWDGIARDRVGNNFADPWHNPSELFYTLLRALPLLPPAEQTAVRQYLQSEYQQYAPQSTSHVGWAEGASRNFFDLMPEVAAEAANYPVCASHCNNGFPLNPENLYAAWMYAAEFGDAAAIFAEADSKLQRNPEFKNSMPTFLNGHIAGHIGYLRLADLASATPQAGVEEELINLLILRAAMSKYPDALTETGFEYDSHRWSVRSYAPNRPDTAFSTRVIGTLWTQMELYGFPLDLLYGKSIGGGYEFGIDFVNLVPDSADFLHDYAYDEVADAVADYNERAPYWFVTNAEEAAGEGVLQPVYDVVALFQAKGLVLRESQSELAKYLDVPAVAVGDLYYLQNLITILENLEYGFQLSADPTILMLDHGGSATITVELFSTGGFSEPVQLKTADMLPLLSITPVTVTQTPPGSVTFTISDVSTDTMPYQAVVPIVAESGSLQETVHITVLVAYQRHYLPIVLWEN